MSTHRIAQLLALGLPLLGPAAAAQNATVVSIGDGDTLRLRQGGGTVTVRLACIDAPETAHSPWGAQARAQLKSLLPVDSVVVMHVTGSDRYGRVVAELSRGGQPINQILVARGMAFVYWHYISGCDRSTYSRLESQARQGQVGVWSVPGGIPRPWDWRRRHHPRQGL